MTLNDWGQVLGGMGLFLLGMNLMTQGLKAAAGSALQRLLAASTKTPWRGLWFGAITTALVQSSSAITVAALGFVNAGVLPFAKSLWVIFGANIGTTTIGWIVAALGFEIKISAAALPLIGLGMALRLSGDAPKRQALGDALSGFGVLFLGLSFLQQAFVHAPESLDLAAWAGHGMSSILWLLLAGLLLTAIMQSSGAAMAIVLTLAQSGWLPLAEGAAAIIGANIGTTVTAGLAAIGATPNAKRAALAHVVFNVLTALVALLLLPVLLQAIQIFSEAAALDSNPVITLALFHTTFNILGVLMMWPLTERLATWLLGRFRTHEEDLARPQYLDKNAISVPSVAVEALRQEIVRLGGLVVGSLAAQLLQRPAETRVTPTAIRALVAAITRLSGQANRSAMSAREAKRMADLLQALRYYDLCAELAPDLVGPQQIADLHAPDASPVLQQLLDQSGQHLMLLNPDTQPFASLNASQQDDFQAQYRDTRASVLSAGVAEQLSIEQTEALLRGLSALRRALEHASKAAFLLEQNHDSKPPPQVVDASNESRPTRRRQMS
jgi:phosphate:Na+ symporter